MKPRRKLWPLFTLLLILVLLLAACLVTETPEITSTVPATEKATSETNNTSDAEPTMVLAVATVAPEAVDNDQEPATATVAPSATATADPIDVESVDSTATPKAPPTAQPTATADPIDIESVDSTATPNAPPTAPPTATADPIDIESVDLTATPDAIPTAPSAPEPRVFVTPKSRTKWRAGSGELFIPFDHGIKSFQYYLYVPKHWYGVFEMRQDTDDTFLFNYIGDPDKKQEVFRVHAFPEHIWAPKKAAGDEGIEFHSLRNVTFVYYLTSENPFSDEEGELFQQMIDDVPQIISEELEIVSRRFNNNE